MINHSNPHHNDSINLIETNQFSTFNNEKEKIKPLDSQQKEIQKEIAKLEGLIAKNIQAEKEVIDDSTKVKQKQKKKYLT